MPRNLCAAAFALFDYLDELIDEAARTLDGGVNLVFVVVGGERPGDAESAGSDRGEQKEGLWERSDQRMNRPEALQQAFEAIEAKRVGTVR